MNFEHEFLSAYYSWNRFYHENVHYTMSTFFAPSYNPCLILSRSLRNALESFFSSFDPRVMRHRET